jgi:predicted nucleic acid-binding protein
VILVDSSIWVDHLRAGDEELAGLLRAEEVLMHPFVIGEIALGHLRRREADLALLHDLPVAALATDEEVLNLINSHRLFGTGIGYVDVHLLAAVRLTPRVILWTRDRRLAAAANLLGVGLRLPH